MRFPGPPCWRWPPCRSCSTGASPSTAATSPPPWPASSPSPSACRSPCCSSGVVARGLDTGKHRALAGVLLAVTGLMPPAPHHLRRGRRRASSTCCARAGAGWASSARCSRVGAMLAAFWSVPFAFRLPVRQQHGLGEDHRVRQEPVPAQPPVGGGASPCSGPCSASINRRRIRAVLRRHGHHRRRPVHRRAPRAASGTPASCPFWYLCLYLLMGVAVTELGPAIGRWLATDPEQPSPLGRLLTPDRRRPGRVDDRRPAPGRAAQLAAQAGHHRRQLHPVVGQVELLGLRAQGRLPRVQGHRRHHGRRRAAPTAAAGPTGSTSRASTASARRWR